MNIKNRCIFLVLFAFLSLSQNLKAQCPSNCTITASGSPVTICAGEAVNLSAVTSCNQLLMNNNFNSGTIGSGWQSTNQAMFSNPCGPGLDGTTHLWLGSTSPAPRNVTTIPFDVSNGGTICFEMKYATQGAASPCEGPDLPDEGIYLQYSVNNGPWTDINYFHPNGGNDPFLTQWQEYCFNIPQAAWSVSTRFRWAQTSSSGNEYDHWGLDNVVISVPPPNATVTWSNGASGYFPPTVHPTTTTTYTATLTDNSGCTATASVTINITDTIFETKPTINHCNGSDLTLNAPTGTGYTWSNGATTQSITVTPTGNTQYKVTVTGGACIKVVTFPVNLKPAPTANFTYAPNPACVGQPIQFTSTTTILQTCVGIGCPNGPLCICTDNPTIFSWVFVAGGLPESTSTNPTYTYNTVGVQQVTLTALDVLNACAHAVTIPVNVINCGATCVTPTPVLTSTSPICLGNSATITISNASTFATGTTFSWNFDGGAATPGTGAGPHDVSWNTPGTYNVTLTATEPGCVGAQATISVIVNPGPTATFTVVTPVCPNQPSTITYTGSATANATYNWNFSGGSVISGSGQGPYQVSWANSGSMTITLDVTESGCSASSSQPVVVLDATNPNCSTCVTPTPIFTTNSPVCMGQNISVSVTGTPTSNYVWNFDGGTAIPGNGQGPHSVSWTSAGTYTISVVVTEPGCTPDSGMATITVYPLPNADAGLDQDICSGATTDLTATGGNQYEWSNGGVAATITVSPSATQTYIVTVVDNNACTQTASVTVNVHSPPNADAGQDQNICIGQSATLTASGGSNYEWNTGDQTSSITVNPTSETTYSVIVSDNYGCSAQDEVVITVSPIPDVDFSANINNGCRPLSVVFSSLINDNIASYLWNFNDPSSGASNTSTIQNPTHTFNTSGTFSISLTLTSTDGCSNNLTQNQMITVYPDPVANFSFVVADNNYENTPIQFTDQSLNAVSWLWDFGDQNSANENFSTLPSPLHSYMSAGTYTVCLDVESSFNCIDTVCKEVNIRHNLMFYAPSAFSPDGDGLNEIFSVYGTGFNNDEFVLYIFDRWGKLHFKSDDLNKGWNGFSANTENLLPEGVYTWMVIVEDFNAEKRRYFGTVTLFR
ncbi:MAG: PKD domain-containing protein [Bacteroidales bacterium]|nr:PKD domain-containing protein [Bacteroidales bacterium]